MDNQSTKIVSDKKYLNFRDVVYLLVITLLSIALIGTCVEKEKAQQEPDFINTIPKMGQE